MNKSLNSIVVGGLVLLGVAAGVYSLSALSSGPQNSPLRADQALAGTSELQAGTAPKSKNTAGEKAVTIPVEGMSCASCAAGLKKGLTALDGVLDAKVSLEHRNVRVRYLAPKISPAGLVTAINKIGYKAGKPIAEKSEHTK